MDSTKKKTTDLVLAASADREANFFHTHDGDAYISVNVGNRSGDGEHRETWKVGSTGFRDLYTASLFKRYRVVPTKKDHREIADLCRAMALYEGQQLPVFKRVARTEHAVFLDLVDERWRCVAITKHGWYVREASEVPVRFERQPSMQALPEPTKGGKFQELRSVLNVGSDDNFALIAGWLLGCLGPPPHYVLSITGTQGSGKSDMTEMLTSLVDPSTMTKKVPPRTIRDLFVAAQHGHVMTIDNLSHITGRFSDALCMAVTGASMDLRKLYTDDELKVLKACKPMLINSIPGILGGVRTDFPDRAIQIELPRIEDYVTKASIIERFKAMHPGILGSLCSAVARALAHDRPEKDLGRMADADAWADAGLPALGFRPGTFKRCRKACKERMDAEQVADDPLLVAVERILDACNPWHGSATDLLPLVQRVAPCKEGLPRTPHTLSARLKRLVPAMRRRGITFERHQSGKRWLVLRSERPKRPSVRAVA